MSAATGHPRPLTEADVEIASLTVARAFAWHEPWGAWALPDAATREQRLRGMVAGDIRERFLPLGRASTIDGVCVSLWCPPASHPNAAEFGPRRDDDAYELFGERLEALRTADALLQTLLPEGEHWYLDTLATEPARMRQGLGGRLLDDDLAALDAAGQFSRPRHAHAGERRLLRAPRLRGRRLLRGPARRAAAVRDAAHPAPRIECAGPTQASEET